MLIHPENPTTKKFFLIVFILLLIAGGLFAYSQIKESETDGYHACTLEAKLCPDGSTVGRVGPDCEFEACPGEINE